MLRRSGKPTLLVANKADNQRRSEDATEFYELGLGEPQPVSAINGAGVGELLDVISDMLPYLPQAGETGAAEGAARGDHRPAERRQVGAGQRDPGRGARHRQRHRRHDARRDRHAVRVRGEAMTLIDTAGIRRPGTRRGVDRALQRHAFARAPWSAPTSPSSCSTRRCGCGRRTCTSWASRWRSRPGLVVCANKWDLIKDTWDEQKFRNGMRRRLRFATWAPIVVDLGAGAHRAGRAAARGARRGRGAQAPRPDERAERDHARRLARRPPTLTGRKRLKLLYVTQVRTEPPTFVFFVNDATLVSPTLPALPGERAAAVLRLPRRRAED